MFYRVQVVGYTIFHETVYQNQQGHQLIVNGKVESLRFIKPHTYCTSCGDNEEEVSGEVLYPLTIDVIVEANDSPFFHNFRTCWKCERSLMKIESLSNEQIKVGLVNFV